MDANTNANRFARHFGFKLKTVQQTFVLPVDPTSASAETRLVDWLDHAQGVFDSKGLAPTLEDVLYLPQDLEFCLSPGARSPAFAVSYAFETNNKATLANAIETLSELADDLWDQFQGRVSLVKTVSA